MSYNAWIIPAALRFPSRYVEASTTSARVPQQAANVKRRRCGDHAQIAREAVALHLLAVAEELLRAVPVPRHAKSNTLSCDVQSRVGPHLCQEAGLPLARASATFSAAAALRSPGTFGADLRQEHRQLVSSCPRRCPAGPAGHVFTTAR